HAASAMMGRSRYRVRIRHLVRGVVPLPGVFGHRGAARRRVTFCYDRRAPKFRARTRAICGKPCPVTTLLYIFHRAPAAARRPDPQYEARMDNRPTRRLRIFLRDFRMLEATVHLAEGQALASYFANRKSYVNLNAAHWT